MERDLKRCVERVERVDTVSPGADSRVTDLGESSGLKVPVERLVPVGRGGEGVGRGSEPAVHGVQ